MTEFEIFLTVYIMVNIVTLIGIALCSNIDGANCSFVNPVVIYDNIRVNWFGAGLLSLVLNVLLPAVAIPYWIYKLCTVGR